MKIFAISLLIVIFVLLICGWRPRYATVIYSTAISCAIAMLIFGYQLALPGMCALQWAGVAIFATILLSTWTDSRFFMMLFGIAIGVALAMVPVVVAL